jgi:hypothetical protein
MPRDIITLARDYAYWQDRIELAGTKEHSTRDAVRNAIIAEFDKDLRFGQEVTAPVADEPQPSDPYAEGYEAAHNEVIEHAQAHVTHLEQSYPRDTVIPAAEHDAIMEKIRTYEHVIAWSRGKLNPPTADLPPGIIAISLNSPEDVDKLFDILGEFFGKDGLDG